uniref:Uncharacterized protein n=1 Tax=Anopheles atroparvus TaxID=41427 RepID=A0AAG5DBP9_ANOAO
MSVSQNRGTEATGVGGSFVPRAASFLCRTWRTSTDNRSSLACRISMTRSRFSNSFSKRAASFASPAARSPEDALDWLDRLESHENPMPSSIGTLPIVQGLVQYSSSLSGHNRIDCHWLPSVPWRFCSAITSSSSLRCSSASFWSRFRRKASSSRSQSAFGFMDSFSRIFRFKFTMKLLCRSSLCFSFAYRFDTSVTAPSEAAVTFASCGPPVAVSANSPLGITGSWLSIFSSKSVASFVTKDCLDILRFSFQ